MAPRRHDLDAHLLGDFVLPHRPHGRVGALARAEPALAGHRVGDRVVVTDHTGACVVQRLAHPLGIRDRGEHDDLVQRGPARGDRGQVAQAERCREGVGDAGVAVVGVGVGGQQPAAGAGQRRQRPALRGGLGDAVHTAQEQRVVGQQQVGVPGGRLPRHGQHRVDREQHPSYDGSGIACRQPDGVPVVGGLGGIPAVDQIHEVRQGRRQRPHAVTLAGWRGQLTWRSRPSQ